MKRIFITLLVMFSLILSSCNSYFGPGMADYSYNLSEKYRIAKAGDTFIAKIDKTVIGREVTGIAWDENYILVKQSKDKKINYWIINIKEDKVYGPLSEKDFENKKKELKVDSKLILKNPEKYKSLDKSQT